MVTFRFQEASLYLLTGGDCNPYEFGGPCWSTSGMDAPAGNSRPVSDDVNPILYFRFWKTSKRRECVLEARCFHALILALNSLEAPRPQTSASFPMPAFPYLLTHSRPPICFPPFYPCHPPHQCLPEALLPAWPSEKWQPSLYPHSIL